MISYQSLLLSTIVLNDNRIYMFMVLYSWNLLREEIFANSPNLLSAEIFAILNIIFTTRNI